MTCPVWCANMHGLGWMKKDVGLWKSFESEPYNYSKLYEQDGIKHHFKHDQ